MRQNVGLTQHSWEKICYPFITHIGARTHKNMTQETRNPQFSKFNKKSHIFGRNESSRHFATFLYIFFGDTSLVVPIGIPHFSGIMLPQRII